MDDERIIELYFARSEEAIEYTDAKYGHYCKTIAYNVLGSFEDMDECVNDTYIKVWNSIPPTRPRNLKAFLGKITRNISLNIIKARTAQKRWGNQYSVTYEELANVCQSEHNVDEQIDELVLKDSINRFLSQLPKESRQIFVARYFYFESITQISKNLGITESKVKMSLLRVRNSLKKHLEREGYPL